ncbi:DUF6415 family natural product biosynthesis protein [Streptomyces sp. NPDC050161]|uniref:DUF6415 family natural product biosynthesis protein n=1 Tax=Streptomyces sp. NPDC050161 TaxID=3365604 RepID=UPI0037AA5178
MKTQDLDSASEATAAELAGHESPLDFDGVRYSISRARGQSSVPFNHGALITLESELCGYIGRLLPAAREAAGKLPRDSAEWHRRISRLNGIELQVEQGLGEGVLSAHVQVQQLARDCRWLIDHQE